MKLPKAKILEMFKNYVPKGHTVLDSQDEIIKLGDTVFNFSTKEEFIADKALMKNLDFGAEIFKITKVKKLTVIKSDDNKLTEEPQEENYRSIDLEDEIEECECSIAPKKIKKSSTSKDLISLRKLFDVVEISQNDKFQTLTIKDASKNESMDWEIWLNLRVQTSNSLDNERNHSVRSDDEYMNGALKNINRWVQLITKYKEVQQTSLFSAEDSEEIILEEEPERPTDDNQEWNKYWKELERVKKSNILKQYEFFDVANIYRSWFDYDYIENIKKVEKLLPRNSEEMIQLLKKSIIEVTQDDRQAHGRFDNFWWNNSHSYLKIGGVYSDFELLERVESISRIYLVPYKGYYTPLPDDNYTIHNKDSRDKINYHFYFDYGKINTYWSRTLDNSYELYDKEFIQWLRDWFNIQNIEPLNDIEATKNGLTSFYEKVYPTFDFLGTILNSKNEEEYIATVKGFIKKNTFSEVIYSSLGHLRDGYKGSYNVKNGSAQDISIEQRKKTRSRMGYSMSEDTGFTEIIWQGKNTEIHKKAFELFCDREAIEKAKMQGQGSLF